tara:strand:- start:328 stop:711 length:384 start_codon:yes stop_codon:yes gene_type:complete
MGHGIGPQSLGAAGQNPKSKPCGTPVKADSTANFGTPLNSLLPGMGPSGGAGIVSGIGSLFSRNARRKKQFANNTDMADPAIGNIGVAGPGPASPGGGSGGIQSDLEGLQSKLADLKSQIDNLANTV